jgi:hypothetical protein
MRLRRRSRILELKEEKDLPNTKFPRSFSPQRREKEWEEMGARETKELNGQRRKEALETSNG